MGSKPRRSRFTGTLKAAVMRAVGRGEVTKQQILERVRQVPKARASIRKLTEGLRELIDDGKLEQIGQRARARFRRA